MPDTQKTLKLFVSWARGSQDDKLVSQLKKHLSMLEHRGLVDVWEELEGGVEVEKETKRRINASDIILLLISVEFFSDSNCEEELKLAMQQYEEETGSTFVIPVMLRRTYMGSTVLTKLKMLPSDKYPVVHKHWENIDEAFTKVIDEVMKVVKYAQRKKESLAESIVKNDRLEITNPSLKDYKEAVEVKNVHSINIASDIGGIQNTTGSDKQERIIDDFLNKSIKLKSVVIDDIEISRSELLLKKAILLHKSSIRNDDASKLKQSYKLLDQARQLDPKNIEILLEIAKVLVVLTPDDPTDEEEVLEQIELMVQNPRDDDTAFYLAQARLMLATSNMDFIDEDLLRKAKLTFKRLGHEHMVKECDDMLEIAEEVKSPKAPPPLTAPTVPAPPPLPKAEAFHPFGEWSVEVHSLIPNTIYLNLYPNGTMNGKQMYMPFTGNWSFQDNYLYIQGFLRGFPFEFIVQIQYEQHGQYFGMGVDGNRYVFQRINKTQKIGDSGSGMRS